MAANEKLISARQSCLQIFRLQNKSCGWKVEAFCEFVFEATNEYLLSLFAVATVKLWQQRLMLAHSFPTKRVESWLNPVLCVRNTPCKNISEVLIKWLTVRYDARTHSWHKENAQSMLKTLRNCLCTECFGVLVLVLFLPIRRECICKTPHFA